MQHRAAAVTVAITLVAATACASSGGSTPTAPPSSPPASTEPSTSAAPSPPVALAASPTPSATAATTPVCATAQLRLSVSQGDGGAGQFHQLLLLTNRGARCSLHGYPGVSFLDAAGHQLGSPAAESPGPITRVFLAPGSTASATLTYSNAAAYPDSSCRPQQASTVRVYPPGERKALLAGEAILVCSAAGSGQLHVGAMQSG